MTRLHDIRQTNRLTREEQREEAVFRIRRTARGARLYAIHEGLGDNGRRKRWPLLTESMDEEWAWLVSQDR